MKKIGILGWTLIELMIVVAIIGILAAVIIPHLQGDVKCDANGCVSYSSEQYVAPNQQVYQDTILKK